MVLSACYERLNLSGLRNARNVEQLRRKERVEGWGRLGVLLGRKTLREKLEGLEQKIVVLPSVKKRKKKKKKVAASTNTTAAREDPAVVGEKLEKFHQHHPKKLLTSVLSRPLTPPLRRAPSITRLHHPFAITVRKQKKTQHPYDVFDAARLPFTQSEYFNILTAFEELDADDSGSLDWGELCGVGTRLGSRIIDYRDYKRMDRDGNGTVDFLELLRVFFPTAQVAVLKRAIKKWGAPHANRGGYPGYWKDSLPPHETQELTDIYDLYTNEGRDPLTYALLRRNISTASISDPDLKSIFTSHDTDRDNVLSLDEFAAALDAVYGRKGEHSLKLYFQPESSYTRH